MYEPVNSIGMEKSNSDSIIRELEETKVTMEKLKDEYQNEKQRSDNLESFQNEILHKLQDAKAKIEILNEDLSIAKEEASRADEMIENLKADLREKELLVKDLSHGQEQAKTNSKAQVQNFLAEKEKLLSVIDEAHSKMKEQDVVLHALKDEVEALKKQLSVSQKKCVNAEERAKALQEVRLRDDILVQFELEKRELQEKLKWKNEQFQHLEEAHKKLQDDCEACRKEWETERTTLLEANSSLHSKLELTTKLAESIQSELQRCKHALAQEERKRKLLEIQLADSKTSYENISSECEEAKTSLLYLNDKWEKEMVTLRTHMVTKEACGRLELENHDLKVLVKELQESQISQAGSVSSLSKLRQKLKGLEQVHKDCSTNMKVKENEWNCRLEFIVKELEESKSELNSRMEQIEQLKAKLDDANMSSVIIKKNEELSHLVPSLESECRKLQLERSEFEGAMNALKEAVEKKEEKIVYLAELLKQKNECLLKAQEDTNQQCVARALLAEKAQELEDRGTLMHKELQTYKEMVKELNLSQEHAREKTSEKERVLQDDFDDAVKAFEKANLELMRTGNDLLLKDKVIEGLKHEVAILEVGFLTKDTLSFLYSATMAEQCSWDEKEEGLTKMVEEKTEMIKQLQEKILQLEKEELSMTIKLNAFEEMVLSKAVLSEYDNQMKNMLVADMESSMSNLRQKLLHFEKLASDSKRKERHAMTLVNQLNNEVKAQMQAAEKLKTDKIQLIEEVRRLTAAEDEFLKDMEEIAHKFGLRVCEDATELRSLELVLDKMEPTGWALNLSKVNESNHCNGSKKLIGVRTVDGRSPLKDLNG